MTTTNVSPTTVQVQGVAMTTAATTDFVNPYTGAVGVFQTTTVVEDRADGRYINGRKQNPDAEVHPIGTALATGYVLCKEDIKPEKVGVLYAVWVEGKDAKGDEYDTLVSVVDDTQDIIVQFLTPQDALGASAELRAKAKAAGLSMTYTAVTLMPTD